MINVILTPQEESLQKYYQFDFIVGVKAWIRNLILNEMAKKNELMQTKDVKDVSDDWEQLMVRKNFVHSDR